jgi:hypothetical protein
MIGRARTLSAATAIGLGFLFDAVALGFWLLALSGVLSRHPWVFMALGLAACVLEATAIALTVMSLVRKGHAPLLATCLVLGGAVPPLVVLGLAVFSRPF